VGKMKMDEVARGMVPFMLAQYGVLFLLVLCPWIVTVPAKWLSG
jgi:TRAP-type C4-dicarboxylate transport system permease large subunit